MVSTGTSYFPWSLFHLTEPMVYRTMKDTTSNPMRLTSTMPIHLRILRIMEGSSQSLIAPNSACDLTLLRCIQRVQKQLFKATAIAVYNHTDRGAILAHLRASALIAFFDNSEPLGFKSRQRIFGKDRRGEWIPKIVAVIELTLIFGQQIKHEGGFRCDVIILDAIVETFGHGNMVGRIQWDKRDGNTGFKDDFGSMGIAENIPFCSLIVDPDSGNPHVARDIHRSSYDVDRFDIFFESRIRLQHFGNICEWTQS